MGNKTQLDYLIGFWKNFSFYTQGFLSPSMQTLIKETIDFLQKLKESGFTDSNILTKK